MADRCIFAETHELVPAVTSEDGRSGASWHLFNDFLVKPVTEEEVLSFPGKWKVCRIHFGHGKEAAVDLDLRRFPLCSSSNALMSTACSISKICQ